MPDPPDLPPPVERNESYRASREPGSEYEEHVVYDVAAERRQMAIRINQIVWLILGIIEGLIAIRVLLRLIGANPRNPFASFIYALTSLFLAPFFGLTGEPSADGLVLEVSSLIAMLVYLLFFWVVTRVVWLVYNRPSARHISTYERHQH